MTTFLKRFTFTHIRENGHKRCITYARPVVSAAVTLLVNSNLPVACREVMIIWCISAVGCNIGEVNPHFAVEALENSWAATSTTYSAIVVFVCSRLLLKSARTAHVYIPNTYYARAWRHRFQRRTFWVFALQIWNPFSNVCIFSPQSAVVV